MNRRQWIALIVGAVAAIAVPLVFAIRLDFPPPAPERIVPGPRVLGVQTETVYTRMSPVPDVAFYGIAIVTAGAVYALRSRRAA